MPVLRRVSPDDSGPRSTLARPKLEYLDSGILGEEFPEGVITVSPNADHFALMAAGHVARQVIELVASTCGDGKPVSETIKRELAR